jgi:hypothetical protein
VPAGAHPRLRLVETEKTDRLTRQKYARLVVRNNGRTMAHNCCAAIDYLKRTDPAGTHFIFRTDLIDLKWSLSHVPTTLRHVPVHGYRLLDVAHSSISKDDLNAGKHGSNVFWIDGDIIPQRLVDEFRMDADYEFHAWIYGDNAAPIEYSFRVKAGRTLHDLVIEPCADPRPQSQ